MIQVLLAVSIVAAALIIARQLHHIRWVLEGIYEELQTIRNKMLWS